MNPNYLKPYKISTDSIIIIQHAKKHHLTPQQLHNLLRYYNGHPLNTHWETK